jgi:hypothetical protein
MREATAGRVWLRTTPGAWVSGLALELRGDTLVPSVELVGDTEDLQLALSLSLDGKELAAWPAVPAGGGLAPRTWSGEVWDIGRPALVVATARLETADGKVVDTVSRRVGLRDARAEAGAMVLNGRPAPLLALRVLPEESAAEVARTLAVAGGNALEVHGNIVGSGWYETTDEWGLGVVVTPRCEGNQQRNSARPDAAQARHVVDQNGRLLRAAASRPSLLAWTCEGTDGSDDARCGYLTRDPLGRAVLGAQVPAAPMIDAPSPRVGRRWVIEVAPNGFRSMETFAEEFLSATGTGGPGGVLLAPPPQGREAWLAGWATVRAALGANPWTIEARRSRSVVVVAGLAPGELAALEVPGQARAGAYADARGEARIEAWHEGPATVVTPRGRQAVVLRADRWDEQLRRVDHAVRVAATATGG